MARGDTRENRMAFSQQTRLIRLCQGVHRLASELDGLNGYRVIDGLECGANCFG